MAGVAENLNVRVTLTLEKPTTKVARRQKLFSIEQLSSDYQVTFLLRCVNFILTATVYGMYQVCPYAKNVSKIYFKDLTGSKCLERNTIMCS